MKKKKRSTATSPPGRWETLFFSPSMRVCVRKREREKERERERERGVSVLNHARTFSGSEERTQASTNQGSGKGYLVAFGQRQARGDAAERGGNTAKGVEDICLRTSSSHGQNPALTVSGLFACSCRGLYRGTSLIRNCAPPSDHHRALGIALLLGPTGGQFLMSEVTL